MSGQVSSTVLSEAFALVDRLNAKLLATVGEHDAAEVWRNDGATSITAWLRHHTRRSGRQAGACARTAGRLRALPVKNPALLAADGAYLLLYSGGWWESDGYATGYATCDTPLGPCTKASTDGPLLASAGPAGDQWLAYHAWTTGAIGYDNGGTRSLRFAASDTSDVAATDSPNMHTNVPTTWPKVCGTGRRGRRT